MSEKSCLGCKYLYADGSGYSNYTWMETYVRCAIGNNAALKGNREEPSDWLDKDGKDQWEYTMNGRCQRCSPGVYITLDPDRQDHPSAHSKDAEQISAILEADGRDTI